MGGINPFTIGKMGCNRYPSDTPEDNTSVVAGVSVWPISIDFVTMLCLLNSLALATSAHAGKASQWSPVREDGRTEDVAFVRLRDDVAP